MDCKVDLSKVRFTMLHLQLLIFSISAGRGAGASKVAHFPSNVKQFLYVKRQAQLIIVQLGSHAEY
jgi:hypothetical protein